VSHASWSGAADLLRPRFGPAYGVRRDGPGHAFAGPVALLAAALLASSCSRPLGGRPQTVVLVSIDTLRADRLPVYGYPAGATPRLDALAREAVVFEDAYSHYPLTLPAHASLLTGLIPPRHGVRNNVGFRLDRRHRTLATRFREAGWRAGGAVSAFSLTSGSGISQGFEFYEDSIHGRAPEAFNAAQRDGAQAVEALGSWLRRVGRDRAFAFLHLYEPHTPYQPPERHRGHAHPYDGEIAYADELVGRFLDVLAATGRRDGALVVVTADHGEGLGDHGEDEHGMLLYRETVRVPLLVRLPRGSRGGTRVAGAVSHADVAATLLDLAGLDSRGLDGAPLVAELASGRADRTVYSETLYPRYACGWSELRAATDSRHRYVKGARAELFALREDPSERRDRSAHDPGRAAAMDAWLERLGAGDAPAPAPIDADAAERLRGLGYLVGSAAPPGERERPDPRDHVGTYQELKRAMDLRRAGRDGEAVEALRRLLAREPDLVEGWDLLGQSLARLRRHSEAVAALEKGLAIDPARPTLHLALVREHVRRERLDLAAPHAELASGGAPGGGAEVLAQVLLADGRLDEASVLARRSLGSDSGRLMAHYVLGVVAHRQGRCDDALVELRAAEAAAARGGPPSLLALVGDCLRRLGRSAEAEVAFRDAIERSPLRPEPRLGLARLRADRGRLAEARTLLEEWIAVQPTRDAEAYLTLVRMLRVAGDGEAAREWADLASEQFPTDLRFRALRSLEVSPYPAPTR
jgi:arylsulfatase A-like enzyme/Tfp pilus assembly protein PilF